MVSYGSFIRLSLFVVLSSCWNATLSTVWLGQDSHLSVCTIKCSSMYKVKLSTRSYCQLVVTACDFDSDTRTDVLVLDFSKAFDKSCTENFYLNLKHMTYTDQFFTYCKLSYSA